MNNLQNIKSIRIARKRKSKNSKLFKRNSPLSNRLLLRPALITLSKEITKNLPVQFLKKKKLKPSQQ